MFVRQMKVCANVEEMRNTKWNKNCMQKLSHNCVVIYHVFFKNDFRDSQLLTLPYN